MHRALAAGIVVEERGGPKEQASSSKLDKLLCWPVHEWSVRYRELVHAVICMLHATEVEESTVLSDS